MSEVEELKNRLFYKRENAWEDKTGEQLNNIFAYAEGYINFLILNLLVIYLFK